MKHNRTSKSALPPFSAALLVLALCLSIAAWNALEINQDSTPTGSSPEALPIELKTPASPAIQAAYRAHRHEAASLGKNSTVERTTRQPPGGSILKRAIL